MSETKNVLLVGVGGQGTILASKILSTGLLGAGYDVKMSEVHGMAQRGGSVSTQVRYGDEVFSPIIGPGEADILVAFEAMEALRWLDFLKPTGVAVVNDYRIPSTPILLGKAEYPEGAVALVASKVGTTLIDAAAVAAGLGNPRTMNLVLLGALIEAMGLGGIDWKPVVAACVKPALVEINLRALEAGAAIAAGRAGEGLMLRNYDELIQRVKGAGAPKKVAVVEAHDAHALEAVLAAAEEGIVEAILVGDVDKIAKAIKALGRSPSAWTILASGSEAESARRAVELVRKGEAAFIMKGKIQTADLLKAVVDKESGLRTGSVMSHVAVFESKFYHKLFVMTDGGMLMYPDLDQKRKIIENAVGALRRLGYERPKVAVLAAVETRNEKMQETVDAAELKRMNAEGLIADCVVEGPISFDLAVSTDSARIKGYESPVAGDADILVVPTIAAGNILGKSLVYMGGAKMAGFIVGAKAPIVLTSRGATAEEKHLSLLISAASA